MEFLPKSRYAVEAFLTTLRATEWVGVVVLLFTLAAVWTSVRGSRLPAWNLRTRATGLAALAGICASFWIGVSVHIFPAAVLLAVACGASVWSVLLRFGVGWRRHIRPGIVPALLLGLMAFAAAKIPSLMAPALLLLGFWVRRTYRRARMTVDRDLNELTTRALVLAHYDAAAYLADASFQRFGPGASNLLLLTLAQRSRDRADAFPRARATFNAHEGLRMLSALAENAVDQRLRTDKAAHRASSWVRVLALEFGRQLLHRSGVVWFFNFVSGLVLAVPPPIENPWKLAPFAPEGAFPAPDSEGYVVGMVADLPRVIKQDEIDSMRDRVTRDAAVSGPHWLTSIAMRAEQWREEISSHRRDLRVEIVTEVIWGVYEAAFGLRPEQYQLFDQLRLQTPELVERLSVRHAREHDGLLRISLNGIPRAFHELSEPSALTLRTRDERVWAFRQFETSEAGVELVFALVASSPEPPRHEEIEVRETSRVAPSARRRPKSHRTIVGQN